jgi:hypothetical protein
MMNDFWTWQGWSAVAAIGQAVGAFATAAAVWIALRQLIMQAKCKFYFRTYFADIIDSQKNRIDVLAYSITNNGMKPFTVTNAGLYYDKINHVTINNPLPDSLPKRLEPSMNVLIATYPSYLLEGFLKYKNKRRNAWVYAVFADSAGNEYRKKFMKKNEFIKKLEEMV